MINELDTSIHPLKSNGPHTGKRIFIGADHNGKQIKDIILPALRTMNDIVIDISDDDSGENRDYVDLAYMISTCIKDNSSIGILICGNGIGMSIVANRSKNVIAARCKSERDAIDSRVINNANVICLGASHSDDEILNIIKSWISTPYSGRKEHVLDKIVQNDARLSR